MKRQITILARGSKMGSPIRAPPIPINAPTEDNASERWSLNCHISAAGSTIIAAISRFIIWTVHNKPPCINLYLFIYYAEIPDMA